MSIAFFSRTSVHVHSILPQSTPLDAAMGAQRRHRAQPAGPRRGATPERGAALHDDTASNRRQTAQRRGSHQHVPGEWNDYDDDVMSPVVIVRRDWHLHRRFTSEGCTLCLS